MLIEEVSAHTRQLARRQETWLRSFEERRIIDVTVTDKAEAIAEKIAEKLFDKEVPRTTNDVIVFYVKVIGEIEGILQEKTYLKKIYGDETFSAIQRTTASGVCSVLDMYLNGKIKTKGFVKQESISWDDFIDNPFGKVYT